MAPLQSLSLLVVTIESHTYFFSLRFYGAGVFSVKLLECSSDRYQCKGLSTASLYGTLATPEQKRLGKS